MAAAKGKTAKGARRKAPAKKTPGKSPSGRPGTRGKADGRAAVKAWIAAVEPRHRKIVQAVDRIVVEEVPDARFALKWSMPLYGREGIGWFASVASFKEHVRVTFFNGAALDPEPPLGSSKLMRSARIERKDELDEEQLRAWMRQAAAHPGWGRIR